MYSAELVSPMPVGLHMLGPPDRQWRDGLDREAPREATARIGLIELLGGDLRRWRLVHPQVHREASRDLGGALHHDVASDLVAVVGQSLGEPSAGRMQQKPRGLDRVAAHRYRVGRLKVLAAVGDVGDTRAASA